MSAHGAGHGSGHHAGDNLLHLLAAKEKELETMVSGARTEAATILSQARADADEILRKAREQVALLTHEHEQQLAADAARIQAEAEAKATTGVDGLRRGVAERGAAAVQMVVDRVIKGS